MKNPLLTLSEVQFHQRTKGVYCACSAHPLVLKAVIKRAKQTGSLAVIESTANQVNQDGGYTGVTPAQFAANVIKIADDLKLPAAQLILGGDHLGPLAWQSNSAETAMLKAEELIRLYVEAGYIKIHIDTSMALKGDDLDAMRDGKRIAQRAAHLCKIAETAFETRKKNHPDAVQPVYIIGSEVPIPGGFLAGEVCHTTTVSDFHTTVKTYETEFLQSGLSKAWANVIAVVIQTGVEFGDKVIFDYNSQSMQPLKQALSHYPKLSFEGHSSDYQTKESLRAMVNDGVSILKVGPALTFALREGLFLMEHIEKSMTPSGQALSHFSVIIDQEMLRDEKHWHKHYSGTSSELEYARKYSYSDRIRYYLNSESVQKSIQQLEQNINASVIPDTLISQYLHNQYLKVRTGELQPSFEELLCDKVSECIDDYLYAISS